jgi:membrane protein implicated in regulation of membrane protease activity
MPTMFWLWLAAAVIFLIIEIGTPTLVFACFTIGAIAAAVATHLTDSYLIQAAVFAIVSIVLIPLTRPLAKKLTKTTAQKTNVDAMMGRPGIVTKKIDPDLDVGQVRVDGQVWQAVAEGVIDVDAKIKVDEVKGARLYVSKTE